MASFPTNDSRCLVVAITDFLREQLATRTDLGPQDRDCLEIAIQCLDMAYGLDERGMVQLRFARPLMDIFTQVTNPVSVRDKLESEEHKNAGNAFMESQMYSLAEAEYTQAIEHDKWNSIFYCNRAGARIELRNYYDAIADCRQSLMLNPDYAKAHARMGQAYALLHRPREASRCFRQALQQEPDNAKYLNNLRVAESQIQRPDALERIAQIVSTLFGSTPAGPHQQDGLPRSLVIISESSSRDTEMEDEENQEYGEDLEEFSNDEAIFGIIPRRPARPSAQDDSGEVPEQENVIEIQGFAILQSQDPADDNDACRGCVEQRGTYADTHSTQESQEQSNAGEMVEHEDFSLGSSIENDEHSVTTSFPENSEEHEDPNVGQQAAAATPLPSNDSTEDQQRPSEGYSRSFTNSLLLGLGEPKRDVPELSPEEERLIDRFSAQNIEIAPSDSPPSKHSSGRIVGERDREAGQRKQLHEQKAVFGSTPTSYLEKVKQNGAETGKVNDRIPFSGPARRLSLPPEILAGELADKEDTTVATSKEIKRRFSLLGKKDEDQLKGNEAQKNLSQIKEDNVLSKEQDSHANELSNQTKNATLKSSEDVKYRTNSMSESYLVRQNHVSNSIIGRKADRDSSSESCISSKTDRKDKSFSPENSGSSPTKRASNGENFLFSEPGTNINRGKANNHVSFKDRKKSGSTKENKANEDEGKDKEDGK